MSNLPNPATGILIGQTHIYPLRVYYEDTDQQGIVFYANYLKYFERGRTEFLRHLGTPPGEIEQIYDRLFVVARADVSYHIPAKLDDILQVHTRLEQLGRVKLLMDQRLMRGDNLIAKGELTIAIIDRAGRPSALPAEMQTKFLALTT